MSGKKSVALEDIAKYRIPSNLRYSPDGRRLAFEVTRPDLEANENRKDVYLAENGTARRITWSADAGIVLWEDSDTLVIRRSVPGAGKGTTELFALSMGGGEARPWLTLPFGLTKLEKLEDGYIAAGRIRADDPDAYLDSPEKRAEKEKAAKEEEDYYVLDELPYWRNGRGYVNGERTALFFVKEKDGKAVCRRITPPSFDTNSFCVDGNTVYFAGREKKGKESLYNRLYLWNAGTGRRKTLWGKDSLSIGGLFTLDHVLYIQASDLKTYGVNETPDLYAVREDGLEKVFVPPVSLYSSVLSDTAEGSAGDYAGEGEYLTLATINAHNAIFALTPSEEGLSCRTVWEQEGMLCGIDACAERMAVIYQDWNHVAEVYEMNRDGGMHPVSDLNREVMEDCYVAEPNRLDYRSCGYDLRGWVLLPQDYSPKNKYPAVLDIHGGPRCVYGETFFHEMQLWTARGFIVFFTNIRGSDGRGDAFADIRGNYGEIDFQNLMDFTDAVLEAYPSIDPKRVCVTGGSYGGFMTNWIIGHTNRFCCAASQRSISNWVSMSFISDIGPWFGPDQCGADSLFGDAATEALWAHSPLRYAAQAKTPTLFIHSDEDYRCPLPEGMQMMQALAERDVETRMVVFRGENHELSRSGKPKHRIRRLSEITQWFEKHT